MPLRKSVRPGAQSEGPTDLEKKITECFEVFDHASNQTVDVREIGTIIRSLGCIPTEAEIQEIIVNVEDQENAGTVPLNKFLPHVDGLIKQYKMRPATAEELLKAFQTLDKENKGYLTKEYFIKLMMEDGEPFTQEEIDEMLTVALDPDTRQINYEYYVSQLLVPPSIYDLIPKKKEVRKLGAGVLF